MQAFPLPSFAFAIGVAGCVADDSSPKSQAVPVDLVKCELKLNDKTSAGLGASEMLEIRLHDEGTTGGARWCTQLSQGHDAMACFQKFAVLDGAIYTEWTNTRGEAGIVLTIKTDGQATYDSIYDEPGPIQGNSPIKGVRVGYTGTCTETKGT